MKRTKKEEAQRAEAADVLRKVFGVKPGSKLYTCVKHVSRSGMRRHIAVFIAQEDGEICDISRAVAHAIGWREAPKGAGIIVDGAGMDMGFQTVYVLGRVLFPQGGPLDSSNGVRQSQAKRDGATHEMDGGYLLKQAWL